MLSSELHYGPITVFNALAVVSKYIVDIVDSKFIIVKKSYWMSEQPLASFSALMSDNATN